MAIFFLLIQTQRMLIITSHQSFFPFPPPPQRNPHSSRHGISRHESSCHFPAIRNLEFKSPPKAASISSGSTADFPEQLMGGAKSEQKRRRRSVAGVDQEELLDQEGLADPDSRFCEFGGVRIHHKISHQETEDDESFKCLSPLIILLHGFGASLFSWDSTMKPLARLTGSKVLAFDRPAFGLTSRPTAAHFDAAAPLNPYSIAFSVLATISFIDMLGAHKAILMGHSAGCLVAVNAYFEAPERVAALILVAPAIVAPFISQKTAKKDLKGKENQVENPFARISRGLRGLFMRIAGAALQMLRGMGDMISSIYKKVLTAVLRSSFGVMLVRMVMDKFAIAAIRNAWYDAGGVTDYVVQGYTKPLRAKGWEMALLEYTLAMLTDSASKSHPPLARRLAEISCPVLVVTGDTDRLIPSWNAKRLSKAIPGSTLEVIKNCGHLPHEERMEEFLSVVARFLRGVSRAPEEQFSQATA